MTYARAFWPLGCAMLLVAAAGCGRVGFDHADSDTEGLSGSASESDDAPPLDGGDGDGDDGDQGDGTPLPRPPHDTCDDIAAVALSQTTRTATVHLETAGAQSDYALSCCGSSPELLVRVEVPSYFLVLMCTGTTSIDVVVLDGCPGTPGDCLRLDCGQDQAVLQGVSDMVLTATVTLGVCPASVDAVFDLLLTADWGA